MNGDHPERSTDDKDAELQREIRAERKFTLAEAIGRLAGPGAMKGASPVSRKQQAEVEIQEYLIHHLDDAAGALSVVLFRQMQGSESLLKSFDQPLVALGDYVRQVLISESGLKELVREADAEWGRVFGERPFFDKDSSPPDPVDPYTAESVRIALTRLAEGLATAAA